MQCIIEPNLVREHSAMEDGCYIVNFSKCVKCGNMKPCFAISCRKENEAKNDEQN